MTADDRLRGLLSFLLACGHTVLRGARAVPGLSAIWEVSPVIKVLRRVLPPMMVLALVGCASLGTKPAPSPAPDGPSNVVFMAGPTLGKRELHTNKCRAGQRLVFRGADIYDHTTKEVLGLRLVVDPIQGPIVRIFKDAEFGPSIVLRSRDCRTLTYKLEDTGKSVNFVSEVRVAVKLDCRSRSGDIVTGNVDLPACE